MSYHAPIPSDGGGMRRDLSPFRFKIMWFSDEGFKHLVGEWRTSYTFLGPPNFILGKEFKCIEDLKIWKRDVLDSWIFLKLGHFLTFVRLMK